jgi:hypothetical protein
MNFSAKLKPEPKSHDSRAQEVFFFLNLEIYVQQVNSTTKTTTRLGELLRKFSEAVCPAYATNELPSEEAARVRRKATVTKKAKAQSPKKKKNKPKSKTVQVGPTSNLKSGTRQRSFNLVTYKLHALGWYPRAIRLYGTSDNYSTQMVCLFSLSNLKARHVCC